MKNELEADKAYLTLSEIEQLFSKRPHKEHLIQVYKLH